MLRIWKLGSLEYNVAPNWESARVLEDALNGSTAKDIIYGPDIDVMLIPDDKDSDEVKLALIELLGKRK